MMTTVYVLAFIRCGATACSLFYPLPGYHYAQIETCRQDAQALTPPPGSTVECLAVEPRKEAKG